MADTNDSNRSSNRRGRLYRPLSFFLIVAAAVLAMSVFFKITRINVEGNSYYTADEIINASGIQRGDNLFFINRIAAGSRVAVKLQYVDSVRINRGLPNIVTIVVEESRAVGYVTINDLYWSVGRTGKCLGIVDKDEAAQMAQISGIILAEPAEGSNFQPSSSEMDKFMYLLEIMDQIHGRGLTDLVSAIDMSDPSDPTVEYDGRFTVRLGAQDDTEYKFGKLLSAIEKLGADDSGTLDVSSGNRVEFRPN